MFIPRPGTRPVPRQAIQMLAVTTLIIIYHAWFTSEVLQKLVNKTIYDVAITTINIT